MSGRRALVLTAAVLLFTGIGGAVSLPVHTQNDWQSGTFTNTAASDGSLQLSGGSTTGTYTSETFDAGDIYEWDELALSSVLNGGEVNVSVETSTDDFSSVQERETFQISGGAESFNLSVSASRYIRFNYSLLNGSSSPTISSTNITLAEGTHFLIRDEQCQPKEKELFSLSNISNAHAANPGHYDQYKVCASGVNQSDYDSICVGGETATVSFFGNQQNYTHLSVDDEYFDYKLCTGKLSIGIRNSCPDTTKSIVSIYELPESHIAKPGVYSHQLCGAVFEEVSLMMQFHLGSDDDVYMNGTANPARGVYEHPDGWRSSYITAQNQSLVAGIVSGENTRTTALGYGESGNDHVFNVTQKRGSASYFVPFTSGDRFSVENRISLIRSGNFLDQFNPNFGMQLVEDMLIQLTLRFTNVDLTSDMVLSSGIHRLLITNIGENAAGEPQVRVNVTAR